MRRTDRTRKTPSSEVELGRERANGLVHVHCLPPRARLRASEAGFVFFFPWSCLSETCEKQSACQTRVGMPLLEREGARAPTTPQLAPTAARKAGASRVVPASENRRPYTTAGQAAPGGPSGEGSSRTTREKATRAPPAGGGYDAACSLVERASGKRREKPTPGCCHSQGGRTEAARRVPRGD